VSFGFSLKLTGLPGVLYMLSTTGLTDAEFSATAKPW